jgi:hypothetical protein
MPTWTPCSIFSTCKSEKPISETAAYMARITFQWSTVQAASRESAADRDTSHIHAAKFNSAGCRNTDP